MDTRNEQQKRAKQKQQNKDHEKDMPLKLFFFKSEVSANFCKSNFDIIITENQNGDEFQK